MPKTELEKIQDRLENIENESVAVIEKAMKDFQKNLATRDELITLIDTQKAEDGVKLAALTDKLEALKSQMTEVDEAKEALSQMQGQLKRLRQNGPLITGAGHYRGKLASAEEARTLGLLMMAATLPSVAVHVPEVTAKYARIMKAIEKNGIELIPVENESGKRIEKAATSGSQASGSLLVTSEMTPGLIMLLESYGLARRLFQRVPMGAASTFTPKMDTLLTFYVPGEGTAPTITDPTVGGVNLTPKTLMALAAYSLELDEDSAVELGELYANLFTRSAAYYEDLCALLGDGTSTYFGFRGICGALRAVDATIGNIKSLVVGTGNAYAELVYADFEGVVGTLPQYADAEGPGVDPAVSWIMHRYFYYTVFIRAALAAGSTGAHSEIILGTAQKQKQACGYPVNFSPVMPKAEANSQICSLFGDYSLGGQFGTRGAAEFATSEQRYFDQGLVAIRYRERIAINAHGVGDTTNAGPIVALITAAG